MVLICPACGGKKYNKIEIVEGYDRGIVECLDCGTIWKSKFNESVIVKKGTEVLMERANNKHA